MITSNGMGLCKNNIADLGQSEQFRFQIIVVGILVLVITNGNKTEIKDWLLYVQDMDLCIFGWYW